MKRLDNQNLSNQNQQPQTVLDFFSFCRTNSSTRSLRAAKDKIARSRGAKSEGFGSEDTKRLLQAAATRAGLSDSGPVQRPDATTSSFWLIREGEDAIFSNTKTAMGDIGANSSLNTARKIHTFRRARHDLRNFSKNFPEPTFSERGAKLHCCERRQLQGSKRAVKERRVRITKINNRLSKAKFGLYFCFYFLLFYCLALSNSRPGKDSQWASAGKQGSERAQV